MACATCRQARCVCEDRATLGVPVTVVDPTGDDLISNELVPCESTSCSSTPTDPTQCCNYFRGSEGDNGPSFIFSAGGPFRVDSAGCPFSSPCPPAGSLMPLPPAPSGAFIEPGVLADVVCLNLPPGTYKFEALLNIRNSLQGTRVVVLFRPDCSDPSTEFVVLDCTNPCLDTTTGLIVTATIQCSSSALVYNSTCNPGFRILGIVGCLADLPNPATSIDNFQILATRLSSRNLTECNASAMIPVGSI